MHAPDAQAIDASARALEPLAIGMVFVVMPVLLTALGEAMLQSPDTLQVVTGQVYVA